MKNCLAVAGSDCSGGAGIQADLKTFSAHGTFGMSVITAVVAENTCRVLSIEEMPHRCIGNQLDAVFEDIEVNAVKLGMLPGIQAIKAVAQKLWEYHPQNIVCDPVMVAKGGCALMAPQAIGALKEQILPLCHLLTPNIPEAQALAGMEIRDRSGMKAAAQRIAGMGVKNVLVKGGHLAGEAVDILFDGTDFYEFTAERIHTKNTHGTGCTLSSAITANLANGMAVNRAVSCAKEYVTRAIEHSLAVGKGHGPLNHFYDFYKQGGTV